MRTRGVIIEDFCNFKLPSLFISSISCDWKCCIEQGTGREICQNESVIYSPIIDMNDEDLLSLFLGNDITKAVVIGGLEPLLQIDEIDRLIALFRKRGVNCDFIIYTGYYPEEIKNQLDTLSRHENVIIKFGRYLLNSKPVFDTVLGVELASNNQFARRIS